MGKCRRAEAGVKFQLLMVTSRSSAHGYICEDATIGIRKLLSAFTARVVSRQDQRQISHTIHKSGTFIVICF